MIFKGRDARNTMFQNPSGTRFIITYRFTEKEGTTKRGLKDESGEACFSLNDPAGLVIGADRDDGGGLAEPRKTPIFPSSF